MTSVNIETNHGNISFDLLPDLAPEHVRNFVKLTKEGFYDGTFAGVCVFGMGTGKGQYYRLIDDLQDGEYRELTRMWSPDDMPKNTESRLISESIKLLPKKVRFIMSYADPSVGHMGTIYQATNWLCCGKSQADEWYIVDGEKIHPRSARKLCEENKFFIYY